MKASTIRSVSWGVAITLGMGGLMGCGSSDKKVDSSPPPLSGKPALVEEAYLYGLPILQSYQAMSADALDAAGPDFKAPLNQLKKNVPVEDSENTVGAMLWMDLRAEPMVLTVPDMAGEWDYSIQLQDLASRSFGEIGTRTLGNDEGRYLIAGPSWKGKAPSRIDKVFQADSDFAQALYRTRYPGPDDRAPVLAIQGQFKAQPLSSYIVSPVVEAAPAIDFPPWNESALGNEFIATLNFCLSFIQPDEAEKALWAKWAPMGVGPGNPFDFNALTPEEQQDIQTGVQSARAKIQQTEGGPSSPPANQDDR